MCMNNFICTNVMKIMKNKILSLFYIRTWFCAKLCSCFSTTSSIQIIFWSESAKGGDIQISTTSPLYIKQAAAAKTIGILARDSSYNGKLLIKLQAIQHLLYAMGNVDHADSQKQASLTLDVRKNMTGVPFIELVASL